MEISENIERTPAQANVDGDVSAEVGFVLDDICNQVLVEPQKDCELPEAEMDSEEFASVSNSPDVDEQEINVDQEGDTTMEVTPATTSYKQDKETLELQDAESDKDDDSKDAPCEPLSYELEQGSRILKEVMSEGNKSVNWAFMEAVDADKMGLYDYYERIKKPMWLKKMRDKFDNREYTSVTQFASDFRLMLENCYRYNGPDHYISKRGQRLETMFEQKLSLLSRELREKTSISATSGQNLEEKVISGTRRRKVLVPHDSTALLNQLRLEEKERDKEQRRQQVLEKQKEREEFEQTLQGWEDSLLEQPTKDYMRTMWEIPAIGHFLFLCTVPLNLGEVMHWELERCFAMPRESLTMQTVMTSLLSTPYQRTNLDKKPLMPYKVWEEKLRVRLRLWYKIYKENERDLVKTMGKIGLEEKFFRVVGHKNPLEKKKYHELTFFQRVWIMKGLCDWCLETQESIREAIECQPVMEQRSYPLGCDADGNTYMHFPQFCGQDLRVYRQAPIKMPKLDKPKPTPYKQKFSVFMVPPATPSPKKRKASKKRRKKKEETPGTSSPTPRSRHSRLRQNPKQISPVSAMDMSDTESTAPSSDEESTISENSKKLKYRKPLAFEQLSDNDSREANPTGFFKARFATLERIKDTPSRESTPAPSPIPTRLTRSQMMKDDSSRASTPNSENSTAAKQTRSRSKGRSRRGGAKGKRNVSRKVNLDDEDDNSSNVPETNGSIVSNDLSVDMNDASLIDADDNKNEEESSNEIVPGFTKDNCGDAADGVGEIAAEDMSNSSSLSTSKSASQINSKETVKPTEMTTNKPDTEVEEKAEDNQNGDEGISSRVAENQDSEKLPYNSIPSSVSCDQISSVCPEPGNADPDKESNQTPFQSYSNETVNGPDGAAPALRKDSPVAGVEGDSKLKTRDVEPCEPSTSGLNPSHSPLVVKEESNDSASTSPYSVSELSNIDDEEETNKPRTSSAVKIEPMEIEEKIKMETETKSDIKTEVKDEVKCKDVKNETADENVSVKEEKVSEEKMEINGEVTKEEIKKEEKGEEKMEESEDEEPEISEPEPGEFELVVDNIDDLRDLVKKFADPEPIIEKKGKKEKIIHPPPRKRCEKELHDRLLYLLTELEPWESKLQQANKRAKIRLRKEHESYVEEPEPKEDVWSSEEEVEESSDSEANSSDENQAVKTEEPRPKRSLRKRNVTPEMDKEALNAELPEELGISSRGRIRKRRIIPNNIEDQGLRKKRKEPDHSPSPTPNILQRSKSPSAGAVVSTMSSGPPPQFKAVLNQLHRPSGPAPPKGIGGGGFQLLSINNQMVLVSTGPQKDKNGNPVPSTQPTVLAHISGSSQPVALPLSVVNALQAQAKQQQQQQQQQQQTTTAGQQALKTFITNKVSANAVVSQPISTATIVCNATNISTNVIPVASSVSTSAVVTTVTTLNQQSGVAKTLDPKLLQQLLLQQGKITVTPSVLGVPRVQGAAVSGVATNQVRPQLIQGSNVTRLPGGVIHQLVGTTNASENVQMKSPGNSSGAASTVLVASNAPAAGTAFSNLIQAGLMPQGPKVASFVAVEGNSNTQQEVPSTGSGEPQPQIESKPASTFVVSSTGQTTSMPTKAPVTKQPSPDLISKLETQGISSNKQQNIATVIQANPGLFKASGSPPKQKYASNITVKSLLEKRAQENMRHKFGEVPEGKDATDTTAENQISSNVAKGLAESSNMSGERVGHVEYPNASASETPVVQEGTIRKIQLTPQKIGTQQQQQQVRAQLVQQPSVANSLNKQEQPCTGPTQTVLTIQQNLTPQQIQLLRQQLTAKFGAQNIPQNIQIVQQIPAQQQPAKTVAVQNSPMKQIKVPSGTVTIQPKSALTATAPQSNKFSNSIDSALKTVMTTVQTSLPTAQIKVSSPFASSARTIKTITSSAMKSPILAVPAVETLAPAVKTISTASMNSSISSTKIIPGHVQNAPVSLYSGHSLGAATVMTSAQHTGGQVQMRLPAAQVQGTVISPNVKMETKSAAAVQPAANTVVNRPQMTVQNLLLQQQQQQQQHQVEIIKPASVSTTPALNAAPTVLKPASQVTNVMNTAKPQVLKIGGKVPLSPKTKISSMPYTKPQTIQQIMEAKASSANKLAKAYSQTKPTAVMSGSVSGTPVAVTPSSPAISSPIAVTPSPAKPTSPAAGTTMTNVMATIGGKSVQLRVAVAPGQNLNQILQSPQLQQQLQQLQKNILSVAPGGKTLTQPPAPQTQFLSQPVAQTVVQQPQIVSPSNSVTNTNVVKTAGGQTIRTFTGINQHQVISGQIPQVLNNSSVSAAPQVLNAKTAAPRVVLTATPRPNNPGTVNTQMMQSQANILTTVPAVASSLPQTQNVAVQQVPTSNSGPGKVVLVNVGGQIMAAQSVGGKTVLVPQGVSLVGQNTTGLVQGLQTQLVANVQPKIAAAPPTVGTIGLQPIVTQQTVTQPNEVMTSVAASPSNDLRSVQIQATSGVASLTSTLPPGSPALSVASSVPTGGLMMVGSGLMPVPATQAVSLPLPGQQLVPGTVAQMAVPARHSIPQQIQIVRQERAGAVITSKAESGGLEQLALAAVQVQEAMQHQTNAPLKPLGGVPNVGSNHAPVNNNFNAHTNMEYATLANGTSLP